MSEGNEPEEAGQTWRYTSADEQREHGLPAVVSGIPPLTCEAPLQFMPYTKAEIAEQKFAMRVAHNGGKRAWAERGVTLDPRIAEKRDRLANP